MIIGEIKAVSIPLDTASSLGILYLIGFFFANVFNINLCNYLQNSVVGIVNMLMFVSVLLILFLSPVLSLYLPSNVGEINAIIGFLEIFVLFYIIIFWLIIIGIKMYLKLLEFTIYAAIGVFLVEFLRESLDLDSKSTNFIGIALGLGYGIRKYFPYIKMNTYSFLYSFKVNLICIKNSLFKIF